MISWLTKFPAKVRTFTIVSMYHFLLGAYFSTAIQIFALKGPLNSSSETNKQFKDSLTIYLRLFSLMIVKVNSSARLRMEMSGSFRHSIIVFLWRCTAFASILTTYQSVSKAIYFILLSLCTRNFPIMLIAKTLNPEVLSISIIVLTHSYSTAFPVFLALSVFVATYAKTSFISSESCESLCPKIRRSRRIFICRKGSVTPEISCSGVKPDSNKFFKTLT